MPLNKNLNEAVYANGTDGVTFIGSSEIQDLYQITAHEGLEHFVDLDNQQGGNPWGLSLNSWNENIANNHAYTVYGITRPNTVQLKYMILKPTAEGQTFNWSITLPDGQMLTLISDGFTESGEGHHDNIISSEEPVDYNMLRRVLTFINVDDQGYIYSNTDLEYVSGFYPQLFNIEVNESITVNGSICTDSDAIGIPSLITQYGSAGIKFIIIDDHDYDEDLDGSILGRLVNYNDEHWQNVIDCLTAQDMYMLVPEGFYDAIRDDLPEQETLRVIETNDVSAALSNIQAVIADQNKEKAKLARRKENKLLFKEVGNEIHVVGCKRSPYVESIRIPDEINGKRVTVIGNSAFAGNKSVGTVFLPKYLKRIENDAFYNSDIKLKFNNAENNTYANNVIIGNLNSINCLGYDILKNYSSHEIYSSSRVLNKNNCKFGDLFADLISTGLASKLLGTDSTQRIYYNAQ